jgi:hypothetical protein
LWQHSPDALQCFSPLLGFNVVGRNQAKVMVDQQYATLAEECTPIGHAVNANIAVLATMHCHKDADTGTDGTIDAIIESARVKLASYKVPRSLVFVDEVPRTQVGKADYPAALHLFTEGTTP